MQQLDLLLLFSTCSRRRNADEINSVIFSNESTKGIGSFRSRKTVQELVYDPCQDRTTVFNGKVVSQ